MSELELDSFAIQQGDTTLEVVTGTYQGKKIPATWGAMLNDNWAVGYLTNDGKHIQTSSGEIMGPARITSKWRVNSHWSDYMYQVESFIDGIWYTGRTLGEGMIWKGKRKAHQ